MSFNEHFYFLFYIRPSARRGLIFISGRHMRSKRRCSCVLQFTRLHAVSCVLHRPTSRVIHHSRLIFFTNFINICLFHSFACALNEENGRKYQNKSVLKNCWAKTFKPVTSRYPFICNSP